MSNTSKQPQPILTYDQFRDLYRNLIVLCRYDQHKASELANSFMRKGLVAALSGQPVVKWGGSVLAATLYDLYARHGSAANEAWAELVEAGLVASVIVVNSAGNGNS